MTSTGQTPRGAGGQIAANSLQVNSSKNKKKSCKRSIGSCGDALSENAVQLTMIAQAAHRVRRPDPGTK